jgi:serine protease AprX
MGKSMTQPNLMQVLPCPLTEHAYTDLTGRGVTIAYLDAGFSSHPDLVQPKNRIVHYQDVTGENVPLDAPPETGTWHGTQTTVVGAGNGFLSDGHWRSLAPDVSVVLVKVAPHNLRIEEDTVALGLQWVLDNHHKFDIRVVSISVGAGFEAIGFESSLVDQLAEQLVSQGIVVLAAAGNNGASETPQTIPPANAPSVISVGGYDNHLCFNEPTFDLYWETSFGITLDGFLKPELLGPAVGVVAPILPGTDLYNKAAEAIQNSYSEAVSELTRNQAQELILAEQLVGAHYKQVSGTSFAAPIVASVVAQMLEADPSLGPHTIKQLLIAASDRLYGVSAERQGFGRLNPRRAVDLVRRSRSREETLHSAPVLHHGKLLFHYHGPNASRVELAGDFNGWSPEPMTHCGKNFWHFKLAVNGSGEYRYKYIIDGRWAVDPANLHVEPDGFGGMNSVITVQ